MMGESGGGQETTIETLSVKFKFAEDALEQFKTQFGDMQKFIVDSNKKTHDATKIEGASAFEVIKKYQEAQLSDIELMALRHREIELKKFDDLKKMAMESKDLSDEMRKKIIDNATEGYDKAGEACEKLRSGTMGLKNVIEEVGAAFKINFAEIFTVTALAASTISALNLGTAREKMAGRIGAMTGGDVNSDMMNGYMSAATANGIGQPGASEGDVTNVIMSLKGMGGVKDNDIFKKNGLADMALFGSQGAGVSQQTTLDMTETMMKKMGMTADEVTTSFTHMVGSARSLNVNTETYIKQTMQMTNSLRAYNVDTETASKMLNGFYKEIEEGKMTLGDLTKFLQIGTTASQGQLAYMGTEILSKGSLGGLYKGLSAAGASELTRSLLMGGDTLGNSASDKILNGRRNTAIQEIATDARDYGNHNGQDDYARELMMKMKLQASTGGDYSKMNPDTFRRLINQMATGKMDKKSEEAFKSAMQDPTISALDNLGKTIAGDDSPLNKILHEVTFIAKILGEGLAMMLDIGTGSFKKAGVMSDIIRGNMNAEFHRWGDDTTPETIPNIPDRTAGDVAKKRAQSDRSFMRGSYDAIQKADDSLKKTHNYLQWEKTIAALLATAKTPHEKEMMAGSVRAAGSVIKIDFGKNLGSFIGKIENNVVTGGRFDSAGSPLTAAITTIMGT